MQQLSDIEALIIDMDGVLWHGDRPQAGIEGFFAILRQLGLPFLLATNNASMTAEQYVTKLATMNVTVAADEILTSGQATAVYLSQHYLPAHTRLFVIGSAGLTQPLRQQGFVLTDIYEEGVDLVVCGLDRDLTWNKLASACYALQAGAQLIASNGDTSLPTEKGLAPGNGAILAALAAATGAKPLVIGKPEPIIYQQAMQQLGSDPAKTIAIGDRLDTDILGAVHAGIRSALVLSGVSRRTDLATLAYQPTWVFEDIGAITAVLQAQALN